MRLSLFLRSYAYIASFLSAVRAFNVTVGSPTQCDDLAVSWTGGQAPFEILLIPVYETLHNISVPDSAFSNGKGSYSISQLPLKSGTQFLLTMSDATGFGSGGTTNVLIVGAPVANNNCNTTITSPDFTFELPSALTQCNGYTFSNYDGAVQPITITAVIPGGEYVTFNPPNGSSYYNWIADVKAGTDLVFFMMDSQGRQGGISDIEQVSLSSDTSCLNVNSPSSTASAPSQTSSQSVPSSTSNSTTSVAIIAGASVGGVVFLGLMVVLSICCRRKAPPSSCVTLSPKHKDYDYEGEEDGRIPQIYPFQYQPDHANHIFLPIQPGSQAHSANIPDNDPFTQHLRQISYTGSFAGNLSPNRRMTTASPNTPSYQTLPAGLAPPIHPGTHSPISNASTGNFTDNDLHAIFSQTQSSLMSSNTDGLCRYGDAARAGSSVTLASRQMSARAGQTPPPNYSFPSQTHAVSHLTPPIPSRALSHHTSTRSFAINGPPNQTRLSHLSSSMPDEISGNGDVRNSSISFPGGRMTAVAANTPAQIIVHTDLEDSPDTSDAQSVVELPPLYANRQPPAPQPSSAPRQKSPRAR